MIFLQTCAKILANPGVNPASGLAKHSIWHGVRRWAPLPLTVPLTDRSKLILTQRTELNGCVALAWSQQLYDYNNMSFILHVTQHCPDIVSSCFDVGGNIGIYALLMSENAATRVTTFEPHPRTKETLERILAYNSRTNVRIIQAPLSDQALTLSFSDSECDAVNRILESSESSAATIQVNSVTGASICEQMGYAPDLMKIDTEGHESKVLRGFGSWLDLVKIIIIEENLPREVIAEYLPSRSFAGPFYLDFNTKHFHTTRRWQEDAFYIHRNTVPALERAGFTL
jgi:FkbM family methyltransferase